MNISSPCFICNCSRDSNGDGLFGNGVLSQQLEVIFVLCKVLEVPKFKVEDYLQEFPAVEQWIGICDKCGEVVKRCWGIWEELKGTQRRFQECQLELIGMIREKGGREEGDAGVTEGGRIFRECRQFANEHEYSKPTNPFLEGNLLAQEKVVKELVKTELEEEEDQDCEWAPGDNDCPSSDESISEDSRSENEDVGRTLVKTAKVWKPKPGRRKRCLVVSCSRKFGDWQKLTRHLTSEHSAEERRHGYKLECLECSRLFTNYKSLQMHKAKVHRLTEGPQNARLETRYVLRPKSRAHQKSETKKDFKDGDGSNLECSETSDEYSSEGEDDDDNPGTGRKFRRKPCLVRSCSRKFGGWQTLTKHLTSEHTAEERKNGWRLACLHCSKVFTNYKSLQGHTVKVHGTQKGQGYLRTRYVMSETKKKRERKENARTNKKSFLCPFCGQFRGYSTRLSKLCRHLDACRQTCNVKMDLHCPVCKVFTCSGDSPAEFANHWISCGVTVTGTNTQVPLTDRIFHCKICSGDASRTGRVFFKLHNFLDHYFLHKQLRLECTECGEKLKNTDHSNLHWQQKHSNMLLTRGSFVPSQCHSQLEPHPLPDVYWWCSECGAQFLSEDERDKHLTQEHPTQIKVEKMEQCSFCDKQYTCADELKLHQITTHVVELGKLIPCNLCQDLFLNSDQVLVHRRRFHKNEVLKCQHCGSEFLDTDQLSDHTTKCTRNDPEKNKERRCTICNKLFANATSLQLHISKVHQQTDRTTCHMCGESLRDRSALRYHLFRKHQIGNSKLKQCSEAGCQQKFNLLQDLREHVIRCHGGLRTKCSYCDREFVQMSSLKRHEQLVHKLKEDPSKWHSCDLCPFKSSLKKNLEAHRERMHNPEKWKFRLPCPHCGVIFRNRKKLIEHRRKEHKSARIIKTKKTVKLPKTAKIKTPVEKPLQPCSVPNCPEKFSSSQVLMNHLKAGHSKEERIEAIRVQCSECGKMLAGPNSLYQHKKKVHRAKTTESFVCDVCGKTYFSRDALSQHKRRTLQCRRLQMSEEEATEMCDICGKRYSNQFNLAKHVREQHEGKFREKCELCGKGLESKHKVTLHLAVAHGVKGENLKEYRCSEPGCGKVFYRKTSFQWHVVGVHKKGEPQFGCNHCPKRLYTPGTLRQHVNWVHKGYRCGKFKQKKSVKTV